MVGAALVWFAGTRLAGYADKISQRTGIGQVTIGVLVLGAVTSLPDRSATVAALLGILLVGILLAVLVLIGLLERRDKAMLRMGYDSIAVLVAYSAGMAAILGGVFAE